jgi:hypothetical protein
VHADARELFDVVWSGDIHYGQFQGLLNVAVYPTRSAPRLDRYGQSVSVPRRKTPTATEQAAMIQAEAVPRRPRGRHFGGGL